VVVTWLSFDPDDPETGGLLKEAGLELRLAPKTGPRSPAAVRELVSTAVAAIVSTDPFDASVFGGAPRLRAIARVGVGTDSIDVEAATRAGVAVTTTPGANNETTADHALAMTLAAIRRVIENDASMRRGEWNRAGRLTPWDLHGRTVGLVGYGEIGKAVARRLRGFETEILVTDPAYSHADGFELVDLDGALRRSEILSLHVPLLDSTRGMLGPSELARMKPGAILVNVSRGGLVDEEALADRLETGDLRAAALDVFHEEPPPPSRLLKLPNVVLSPHIAGLSDLSIGAMTRQATRSVLDVLAGRPAAGIVNPAALQAHRAFRLPETVRYDGGAT
jgi:phosphoglycerate dehydrogenase-like enzyme